MNSEFKLEWSVRALAQRADIQTSLFPEFACVADELALEFETSLKQARDEQVQMSQEASDRLEELDAALAAISGPHNQEFWEDEALATRREWADIRTCAESVCLAMGWPTDPPPVASNLYVSTDA
jgi:hypothetical protein